MDNNKVIKVKQEVADGLIELRRGTYSQAIEWLLDNQGGGERLADSTMSLLYANKNDGETIDDVIKRVLGRGGTWATTPMQDQYGEVHFVNSPVLADRRWRVERQNFIPVSVEWLPTGEVWSMDYEEMKWVKSAHDSNNTVDTTDLPEGDLPF